MRATVIALVATAASVLAVEAQAQSERRTTSSGTVVVIQPRGTTLAPTALTREDMGERSLYRDRMIRTTGRDLPGVAGDQVIDGARIPFFSPFGSKAPGER